MFESIFCMSASRNCFCETFFVARVCIPSVVWYALFAADTVSDLSHNVLHLAVHHTLHYMLHNWPHDAQVYAHHDAPRHALHDAQPERLARDSSRPTLGGDVLSSTPSRQLRTTHHSAALSTRYCRPAAPRCKAAPIHSAAQRYWLHLFTH